MLKPRLVIVSAFVLATLVFPAAVQAAAMSWSQPQAVDRPVSLHFSSGRAISCPTASFCVAGADRGFLLVSSAPAPSRDAWQSVHPDGARGAAIADVSCPSASFCVAVDEGGYAISSADPTGGADAWEAQKVDEAALESVSCPSASFCIAVDRTGNILTTRPTPGEPLQWQLQHLPGVVWLFAVSCPDENFCVAVDWGQHVTPGGYSSDVYTSTDPEDPSSWEAAGVQIEGEWMRDISCPTTEFCAAIMDHGVFTSSDPTGGASAWEYTDLEEITESISCASESFCVTVGNFGAVFASDEPEGGAAAWDEKTVTGDHYSLSGVACPSVSFCAVIGSDGDVILSDDPGANVAWDPAETGGIEGPLSDVSCPSGSFCGAVDAAGNFLSTTEPTEPAGWQSDHLTDLPLNAVSCPAADFCAATSPEEAIFTSTEPAAGAGAWNEVAAPRFLADISCPSPSFCAAVRNEEVLISTEPGNPAAAWVATELGLPELRYGPSALHSVSCASPQLCVVGSDQGVIAVSEEPTGGAAAWTVEYVADPSHGYYDPAGAVSGVSCPSDLFCVATMEGGEVSRSGEPLGGAASWVPAVADPKTGTTRVSCAGTVFCVSIGGDYAVASRTPTQLTSDWGSAKFVDSFGRPKGISCVEETSLCVVVDSYGYVFTGSPLPIPPEPEAGGSSGSQAGGSASPPLEMKPPLRRPCRRPHRPKPRAVYGPGGIGIGPAQPLSSGGRRATTRCAQPL